MVKPVATQAAFKPPKSPAPNNEPPPTPRSTIQVVIKQRSPKNDNSSVPGSIQDSADDESELSDVEDAPENAKTRPLFPNLGDSKSGADDDEKEESDHETERVDDEGDRNGDDEEHGGRAEDEEEDAANGDGDEDGDENGEGEGEEVYHTPMEM
ncbi:MAG: hypothetical protein Q9226_008950 [Calogaya cf. arnoldii]